MKINVGAGKQTWPGFFCIDAEQHPKATRPLDLEFVFRFDDKGKLVERIPLPDNCADEIHNYHFIEHIYAWEAPALLLEFRRLLKSGGLLVLECPDVLKCARSLLKGERDQLNMWGLYGDWGHKNPYMMHRHGYCPKTLQALLESVGFRRIRHSPPRTHGARHNRDMRVEALA